MQRTKFDITKTWAPTGVRLQHIFTIPKGTRVIPCGDGENYFVDEFAWIKASDGFLRHDAEHYGIRLHKSLIEES